MQLVVSLLGGCAAVLHESGVSVSVNSGLILPRDVKKIPSVRRRLLRGRVVGLISVLSILSKLYIISIGNTAGVKFGLFNAQFLKVLVKITGGSALLKMGM